jgi:hypothetical protein
MNIIMRPILSAIVLNLLIAPTMAQVRDRPSEGRDSSRDSGSSSSSSSGSDSSSSSSSSSDSSSSSSRDDSSSSSSSSDSSWGSSYDRPSASRTSVRTSAPIEREDSGRDVRSETISSGQVRNVGQYRQERDGDIEYRPPRHRPTNYERTSPRTRYENSSNYVPEVNHHHIFQFWIMRPIPYGYGEGYCYFDNYDYYVYQGYRHRYSSEDFCDYELVDTRLVNNVVATFSNMTCKDAYDACATKRDELIAESSYYDLKDYYICMERVPKENANLESASLPSLTSHLSAESKKSISQYLINKETVDLFKAGKRKIQKCEIKQLKSNSSRCNFGVFVDEKPYPQIDGSVCSNRDTSKIYGCNTNSQMKNAGCLLGLAIREGLCLNEQNLMTP